jgi:hypothetical protein
MKTAALVEPRLSEPVALIVPWAILVVPVKS